MSLKSCSNICSLFETDNFRGFISAQLIFSLNEGYFLFIPHPLILVRIYWLLCVTWQKLTGQISRNTSTCLDTCPPIVSVEEKHSKHKNSNFSFVLFYIGGDQTRLAKSRDSDIRKLAANAVRKVHNTSTKYAVAGTVRSRYENH